MDQSPGFTIDVEIMFSDHKGQHRKGIESHQRKLAEKVLFLNRFLDEQEKVLLITKCCSPMGQIEQLLTGWIIYYLKRALLVITDKRILHIPTTIRYAYRNSIAQILYTDLDSIQLRQRTLVAIYKSGMKEKFHYVSRSERKKLKALLQTVPLEGAQSEIPDRRHLCPRCKTVLEKDISSCPTCYLGFKGKSEGRKLSLIYPGGGYFFTRHPVLGVMDAIIEVIFSLNIIVSFVDMMNGVEGAGIALVGWIVALAIEKSITVYHSNHYLKEFITKEKEI